MEKPHSQHGTLRWSHGMLGVALMLIMFSLVLSSLVSTQYVFSYLEADLFPNSSLSSSDGSACNVNKSTESYRERTAVEKSASRLNIFTKLAETIPALITSGIIGGLSDKFGRTRILSFTTTCFVLSTCFSSVVIYFEIDVYYFIISSTLYSIGGGLFGALSIGFAYISDVTIPGRQRTLMITLLEASVGVGAALSGIISGYILSSIGFFYASLCVSASAASAMLVVVLFLPPSRPPVRLLSDTSIFENARASFTFYFRASPSRYKYVLAIITFLIGALSLLGKQNTEILYQLNAPFCWTSVYVGYYSAISTSASMILGVATVKILQKIFVEEIIAVFSAVSSLVACLVEAFAVSDLMLFLSPAIGFLSALVFPMIRSMLSKLTPPERQGALFAGIAVVEIAANLGSNVGASTIYVATIGIMRSFVFLVFGGLSLITACLLMVFRIMNGGSKIIPIHDVTKDVTGTQVLVENEG
ncbi:lysosomal proton-coupled steroid conjugate and bile acid symporter SLC46A3-like [Ylistrum balloti]|uniref:lysosomal proton-coupled steroid conjugate and bile acid symporter SLC46A3-like n=1 Tax=Ylistrum balloti TaxID=509963 RepID=UPI002905D05F|nr:lysosomal proton-coupled steroid conjugate and bile acid symporter SLC46A3-like [Ylistrum balloti]